MSDTPLIALEIHDASLMDPARVLPVLPVMQAWGYNTLVLHQNDLLDLCTQPALTANYGVSDLRLKKVRNAAAWLTDLVARLDIFGARLFLEIKEPSYHDYALELYPGLLGVDGRPDPSNPDWPVFCRAKVEDLLARVPGLGGLIVNLSSPESRVSLPDHLATQGAGLTVPDWFDAMIAAFRAPLEQAGARLFVRDFSYTADLQSDVLAAVDRCGGAVGASVKITAHDYFPQAPQNPVIGQVQSPLILEFEAFGEHTGWGVIPNCRVAELCGRMAGYRAVGAQGMLVRISWEAVIGASALDSLSAVNVFALPRLAQGDIAPEGLVLDWLSEGFGLTGATAETAARLLLDSAAVPAAAYWQGQVFPRHSCLPSTWAEGWLSMNTTGMGRRDRDLGLVADDPRLTEAARAALFAEKARATALADDLARAARDLRPDLPPALARLWGAFDLLPAFARQFEYATQATFYAARKAPGDLAAMQAPRAALLALARQIGEETAPDSPHARVLLDPAQIRGFVASLPDNPSG